MSDTASDELTADQKRALFEAYEKQQAKVIVASSALDVAVADQIGTGPFRWQDVELTIAKRGDRLMMKTKGDNAVEEIG